MLVVNSMSTLSILFTLYDQKFDHICPYTKLLSEYSLFIKSGKPAVQYRCTYTGIQVLTRAHLRQWTPWKHLRKWRASLSVIPIRHADVLNTEYTYLLVYYMLSLLLCYSLLLCTVYVMRWWTFLTLTPTLTGLIIKAALLYLIHLYQQHTLPC